MATSFNPSATAGTVFGIAGMGISLGLLAHTASNISRQTDRMYAPRRKTRRRKSIRYRPQRSYRMKSRYW